MVDSEAAEQVLQLAAAAPAVMGIVYQKAFASYPGVMDSATGMGLYYLGQRTKGAISKNQPSWDILARWMTIGLCDGFASHEWYLFLEQTLSNLDLLHWQEALVMTAMSSVLFTPVYCAAFLSGLTLLEGKGLGEVKERLEKDYVQLTKATVGTWSMFNCFLFNFVEIDNRVTVAMSAHFVYLIVLALWNEGMFTSNQSSAETATVTQEAQEEVFSPINFDLPPPTDEELEDVMLAGPGLAFTDEMEPVDFDELAEDVRQDVDDFVQEVDDFVLDVSDKVNDVGQQVGDKVNDVGQQVMEKVEDVGQNVVEEVAEVVEQLEQSLPDMVQELVRNAQEEEKTSKEAAEAGQRRETVSAGRHNRK